MTYRRSILVAMAMASLVTIGCQSAPHVGRYRPTRAPHVPTTIAPTGTVECDSFGTPMVECVDGAGNVVASGMDYADGYWRMHGIDISIPGECPEEDSCLIVWNDETDIAMTIDNPNN